MSLHPVHRTCLFPVLFFVVTGCTSTVKAPVSNGTRPPVTVNNKPETQILEKKTAPKTQAITGYHVVARGDTLYSIAWRYDHDYRDMANWNRIRSPYVIYPGQLLRLKPQPENRQEPARPAPDKPGTAITKTEQATTSSKPASIQEKKMYAAGQVKWHWPAQGELLKLDSPTSKKGIDISGKIGQRVRAAAMGDVVYSGSGLLGYGKLIIIKHNDTYLSAYAYNSQLLVKEGDSVKAGQDIAIMGQGNEPRPMLHFEIRKDGKPVNPLEILPRNQS